MNTLRLFIRLSRPLFLLGGFLMCALGVGIADFQGTQINWGIFLLGQAWGTLIQLSTHYLNEYFDSPLDIDNPNRTLFTGGSGAIGPGKLARSTALWAAITSLAIAASLTVLLIQYAHLNPVTLLVMLAIFLGSFFYAVPPIRLESTGYGELTTSIIVANLAPLFAYLLQGGQMNPLLAMVTFPLTTLHLAMLLTFEFPDYATDLKYQKKTLLVRLGWQNGLKLHNALIIISYLLFGLSIVQGLSLSIALPVFLTLPLGGLQIWSMNRIAAGAKPNWSSLAFVGLLLFGLASYFLAFALWTYPLLDFLLPPW